MKITRRELRNIIWEVVENPGSAMSSKIKKSTIASAEAELKKTYEWFERVVFPAIENDDWPVVADQDYNFSYWWLANLSPEELKKKLDQTPEKLSVGKDFYIPRGTSFKGPLDSVRVIHRGSGTPAPRTLTQIYEEIEKIVITHKLNIPMESFPD